MSPITPGAAAVMTCDHEHCAAQANGHGISPIRARAAAATPSGWRDAIVAAVDAGGWIALHLLETDELRWAWNHGEVGVGIGSPVAVHEVYHVLAVGAARFSLRVQPAQAA